MIERTIITGCRLAGLGNAARALYRARGPAYGGTPLQSTFFSDTIRRKTWKEIEPETGKKLTKREALQLLSKRLYNSDTLIQRLLEYAEGKPIEKSEQQQTIFLIPQPAPDTPSIDKGTIQFVLPDKSDDNGNDDVSK